MAANGYSAKVVLQLVVGGNTFSLSHVGSRDIIVRDECSEIPATDAEIHVSVNDKRSIRKVFLPYGISGPRRPILFL